MRLLAIGTDTVPYLLPQDVEAKLDQLTNDLEAKAELLSIYNPAKALLIPWGFPIDHARFCRKGGERLYHLVRGEEELLVNLRLADGDRGFTYRLLAATVTNIGHVLSTPRLVEISGLDGFYTAHELHFPDIGTWLRFQLTIKFELPRQDDEELPSQWRRCVTVRDLDALAEAEPEYRAFLFRQEGVYDSLHYNGAQWFVGVHFTPSNPSVTPLATRLLNSMLGPLQIADGVEYSS